MERASRRSSLIVCALAAGCATAPAKPKPAVSPFQPVAGHAVKVEARDALGEPVVLGPGQPRVAVVFFMSRRSKEEASDLMQGLDEQLLDAPIETVAVVDVQRYAGMMRRLATWQLERSARDARTKRKQRRETRGADASAERVGRWHLIGDFDGSWFTRFCTEPDPLHPSAFVVRPTGELDGPYLTLAPLVAAVRHAIGGAAAGAGPQGMASPFHSMPSKIAARSPVPLRE
jgi:hypothetical protein